MIGLVRTVLGLVVGLAMTSACSEDPTQVGGSDQSGGSTAGTADSTGGGTMNGTASTGGGTGSADGASTMGPGTNPGSSDGGPATNGTTTNDGGSSGSSETTAAVSEGSSTGAADCQALSTCAGCYMCEAMNSCMAEVDACAGIADCPDALMCILMCDPLEEECIEMCGDAAETVEDCLETECPGCPP